MTQNSKISQKKSSDKNVNQQEKTNNYLFCYKINEVNILIESNIKMELLEKAAIYPIPNAPKWYLGMTSLRGDILTVANMHFLLGMKANSQPKRLLKLEHPNFAPLVISIDALPYQINIDKFSTYNNNKQYPAWITSSTQQQKQLFLLADHIALFRSMQANVGDNK